MQLRGFLYAKLFLLFEDERLKFLPMFQFIFEVMLSSVMAFVRSMSPAESPVRFSVFAVSVKIGVFAKVEGKADLAVE